MQAQLVVAVAVGCLVVDALAEAKEALGRRYWAQREEARLRLWAVLVVVRSEEVPQALSVEEVRLLAEAGRTASAEVVVVARTVLVVGLGPGMGWAQHFFAAASGLAESTAASQEQERIYSMVPLTTSKVEADMGRRHAEQVVQTELATSSQGSALAFVVSKH